MRIVCPKCELKGQVDAAPKGAKTRIACVRCATTFDAVLVDGKIQALLLQPGHTESEIESAGGDVSEDTAEFGFAAEKRDENQLDASRQVEAPLVPVDDFSASSAPDLTLEAAVVTTHAAAQESSQELWPQSVETLTHETTEVEEDSVAALQSFESNGAGKISRPPTDVYGMGVRLMRVSPLWLLLAGLGFISFIVFCNWFIKSGEQAEDATSLIATANNHATNQSTNRIATPGSTAQSQVINNGQAAQPLSESGAAFIKTEAKAAAIPATVPSVEPAGVKPAIEEKPAIAASTPERASEAKDGKVTIQVGSYNAASEAEERVARLKSAGFEARSVAVEIPKRGTWYRVQSGRFISRDEAERYGQQLRDKGVVSSFITTDVRD